MNKEKRLQEDIEQLKSVRTAICEIVAQLTEDLNNVDAQLERYESQACFYNIDSLYPVLEHNFSVFRIELTCQEEFTSGMFSRFGSSHAVGLLKGYTHLGETLWFGYEKRFDWHSLTLKNNFLTCRKLTWPSLFEDINDLCYEPYTEKECMNKCPQFYILKPEEQALVQKLLDQIIHHLTTILGYNCFFPPKNTLA